MLHSLASQIDYYGSYIRKKFNWQFVEVYSDEAVTGTKGSRENFDRMLDDCRGVLLIWSLRSPFHALPEIR